MGIRHGGALMFLLKDCFRNRHTLLAENCFKRPPLLAHLIKEILESQGKVRIVQSPYPNNNQHPLLCHLYAKKSGKSPEYWHIIPRYFLDFLNPHKHWVLHLRLVFIILNYGAFCSAVCQSIVICLPALRAHYVSWSAYRRGRKA